MNTKLDQMRYITMSHNSGDVINENNMRHFYSLCNVDRAVIYTGQVMRVKGMSILVLII